MKKVLPIKIIIILMFIFINQTISKNCDIRPTTESSYFAKGKGQKLGYDSLLIYQWKIISNDTYFKILGTIRDLPGSIFDFFIKQNSQNKCEKKNSTYNNFASSYKNFLSMGEGNGVYALQSYKGIKEVTNYLGYNSIRLYNLKYDLGEGEYILADSMDLFSGNKYKMYNANIKLKGLDFWSDIDIEEEGTDLRFYFTLSKDFKYPPNTLEKNYLIVGSGSTGAFDVLRRGVKVNFTDVFIKNKEGASYIHLESSIQLLSKGFVCDGADLENGQMDLNLGPFKLHDLDKDPNWNLCSFLSNKNIQEGVYKYSFKDSLSILWNSFFLKGDFSYHTNGLKGEVENRIYLGDNELKLLGDFSYNAVTDKYIISGISKISLDSNLIELAGGGEVELDFGKDIPEGKLQLVGDAKIDLYKLDPSDTFYSLIFMQLTENERKGIGVKGNIIEKRISFIISSTSQNRATFDLKFDDLGKSNAIPGNR